MHSPERFPRFNTPGAPPTREQMEELMVRVDTYGSGIRSWSGHPPPWRVRLQEQREGMARFYAARQEREQARFALEDEDEE